MSETPLSEEQAKLTRRVPLAIWREVRRALCTLFDLFGEPQQIASRHTLTLKDHQLCVKWLRSVEALMRRMVFLEAALIASACGPLPARERKIAQQSGEGQAPRSVLDPLPTSPLQGEERQRQRIEHDPEHPEGWRVSFRTFPGRNAQREAPASIVAPGSGEPRPAASLRPRSVGRFRSAWPLAERTEALLRVFNNPLPYAQRLAARLRRAKTLVVRLCEPWVEHRDIVTRSLFDALIAPLKHASAVFDTT